MNTANRFDGAAVWAGLSSEQKDVIGAIALELLSAWYAQEQASDFNDGDDPLLRAADAADFLLVNKLREAMVDAVARSELEGSDGQPRLPSMLGQICRECGCSQNDACASGCGWAAPDLCTACEKSAEVQP